MHISRGKGSPWDEFPNVARDLMGRAPHQALVLLQPASRDVPFCFFSRLDVLNKCTHHCIFSLVPWENPFIPIHHMWRLQPQSKAAVHVSNLREWMRSPYSWVRSPYLNPFRQEDPHIQTSVHTPTVAHCSPL